MKQSFFGCLALFAITTGAFAAAPPPANNKMIPLVGANVSSGGKTIIMPTGTLTINAPTLKLDDYIKDLATTLNLSDKEKQQIQGYYLADGVQLKTILNDDALSPLQQARQVADLRDARNARIEALLSDLDRQHRFLEIEARYRVALTELAGDGGLLPLPPATPAPAPPGSAPSQPAPAANAKT